MLTRFVDDLGSLERILRTPLPLAYSVHLVQAVWIHLLLLPVQLVANVGWWACVAIAFTSFTLLGILRISSEIENPFGYDPNDLPLDHYCQALREEVECIVNNDIRKHSDLFSAIETTDAIAGTTTAKPSEQEPSNGFDESRVTKYVKQWQRRPEVEGESGIP